MKLKLTPTTLLLGLIGGAVAINFLRDETWRRQTFIPTPTGGRSETQHRGRAIVAEEHTDGLWHVLVESPTGGWYFEGNNRFAPSQEGGDAAAFAIEAGRAQIDKELDA